MNILISLCWLGEPGRIERNVKWLQYYRGIKSNLGFDKIILLDNASPITDLIALGGTVYDEDNNLLHDNPNSDLIIYRFHDFIGRTGIWEYPYCWRGVDYIKQLIPRLNVEKIILNDTDFYMLTPKMVDYVKNLNSGWFSVFCHKYGFPEAALNVLCKDSFDRLLNFPIPSWTYYNNQHMEWLLPFTHVDKTLFKGCRYGEGVQKQTPDMDWYGQWSTGCPTMVFDLKE